MKEFQNDHVKNLPDTYRKDKDSNNYKILQLEADTVNDFREALGEINSILDLDKATGKTLDMYGERVGQARGTASDQQYLVLIKSKIMQNLSNGTHESVVNAICYTLGCDASEVVIVDGEEPCSVEVKSLPLGVITKAKFTTGQVVALINRMLPCGTDLSSFLFEGTLEFCETEADMNVDGATKGFCDVEGGTTGGYFGVTAGDESETILPI